jgi:ABC-type polysaccharide/polyol phosphate transport system ATPase subunit
MAVIDIQKVSKRYLVQQSRQLLVEDAWRKAQGKTAEFWALRNISFQIEKSEKVAFVGSNGAGKSTLLAIISGVTHATEGVVSVRGRVAALLALGTGLHPDLTGEENIHLIGSLMGLTRAGVRAKFNSIIDFSGLHRFVEAPVRTYSTGMVGRLGFSVAVHADADILVLDEVFAVGDSAFTKKCIEKMGEFTSQGKTVLFVSHTMETVKDVCQRAIWLQDGKILMDAGVAEVAREYEACLASGDETATVRRDETIETQRHQIP